MSDAIQALRAALEAVGREASALDESSDAEAFVYVTELAMALRLLPRLLTTAHSLADVAMLGRSARADLDALAGELAERQARLEEDGRLLRTYGPMLRAWRAATAESERLAVEVAELRRLQAVAGGLEELRRARAELERRADVLAADAQEAAVLSAATVVESLTEIRLAEEVNPALREAVAGVAEAERRLARAKAALATERAHLNDVESQLAEVESHRKALQDACDRWLPTLKAHRDADAGLAELLARSPHADGTGVQPALRELRTLDERLADIDVALAKALRAHDALYTETRQKRGLL